MGHMRRLLLLQRRVLPHAAAGGLTAHPPCLRATMSKKGSVPCSSAWGESERRRQSRRAPAVNTLPPPQ